MEDKVDRGRRSCGENEERQGGCAKNVKKKKKMKACLVWGNFLVTSSTNSWRE